MDQRILEATIKRWKARTDLIWLCNNILDMTRVSDELNGEMIRRMQQFHRPDGLEQMQAHDKWTPDKGWQYTPLFYDESRLPARLPDPTHFPGRKSRLLLDSRGFFKSSINVVAHSIQWILNYPDITILVFQGSLDLATKFLKEIRDHFRYNEKLRRLFPEYCPEDPDNWGTSEEFTMVNRSKGYIRKEPTLKVTSIEKAGAGQHVEVIKYSDIVNEDNARTKERCADIYNLFTTSRNLLVSPTYWRDVEGTRYHMEDTYGRIIQHEMDEQTHDKAWQVAVDGQRHVFFKEAEARAYAKDRLGKVTPDNPRLLEKYYMRQEDRREFSVYINACFKVAHRNPTYDYDDMLDPNIQFLVGPNGCRISRSEKYYPGDVLEREARQTPEVFACQKLNNPTIATDDVQFPVREGQYPVLIKPAVFRQNVRPAYYEISVDIANTVHQKSDYTAIPVAMFDQGGRCYIVEIRHGKFHEEEIADHIIDLTLKYKPRRVLMEKDRGNAGVNVWMKRKCQLSGIHIPIVMVPKHTKMTKNEYIGSMLRPWYISGDLRFVHDPEEGHGLGLVFHQLCNEFKGFPKGRNDDIIDAMTHFFHDKPNLGRNTDRAIGSRAVWEHGKGKARQEAFMRRLGIYDERDDEDTPWRNPGSSLTGWL